MSVVSIAEEAKAVQDVWESLTGSSIAFDIENLDIENPLSLVIAKQSVGTRKGAWKDIPPGKAVVVGTQHNGFLGDGNLGGVIYEIESSSRSSFSFGLLWSDPAIGEAQFYYTYGYTPLVKSYIEERWDSFFTALSISTHPTFELDLGHYKAEIQSGFDPFKITFSINT